jgi:hypothetical protein
MKTVTGACDICKREFKNNNPQALARAIGNRELMRITGLTDSQINNRLRKAKNGLGMEHGFRVNWRNGNHPLFQRMLKDYRGVMLLDIKRKLVPLYAHPTPETT